MPSHKVDVILSLGKRHPPPPLRTTPNGSFVARLSTRLNCARDAHMRFFRPKCTAGGQADEVKDGALQGWGRLNRGRYKHGRSTSFTDEFFRGLRARTVSHGGRGEGSDFVGSRNDDHNWAGEVARNETEQPQQALRNSGGEEVDPTRREERILRGPAGGTTPYVGASKEQKQKEDSDTEADTGHEGLEANYNSNLDDHYSAEGTTGEADERDGEDELMLIDGSNKSDGDGQNTGASTSRTGLRNSLSLKRWAPFRKPKVRAVEKKSCSFGVIHGLRVS